MCRVLSFLLILPLALGLVAGPAHAATPDTTGFRHLLKTPSITCKDCHGTAKPKTPTKSEACNKCHSGIEDKYTPKIIKQGNREASLNVHNSHYGDVECLACHKIHGKGQLMCNECHKWDLEVK